MTKERNINNILKTPIQININKEQFEYLKKLQKENNDIEKYDILLKEDSLEIKSEPLLKIIEKISEKNQESENELLLLLFKNYIKINKEIIKILMEEIEDKNEDFEYATLERSDDGYEIAFWSSEKDGDSLYEIVETLTMKPLTKEFEKEMREELHSVNGFEVGDFREEDFKDFEGEDI